MTEKGAYKNALKEKVRLSPPSPWSRAIRLESRMENELMAGIGDYEISWEIGRPEEAE